MCDNFLYVFKGARSAPGAWTARVILSALLRTGMSV